MGAVVNQVSIIRKASSGYYPDRPPFHPPVAYPELQSVGAADPLDTSNAVYPAVRELLHMHGLDAEAYGRADWNPLGRWIQPGQTVLLKPNMVLDKHPRGGDLDCLVTHGSVLRPLLDYVLIALKGSGRMIIGDSPLQGTDFKGVLDRTGIGSLVESLRARSNGVEILLTDFRRVHARFDDRNHVAGWRDVPGDPLGYVEFDLGADSALQELGCSGEQFRVSNYRAEETAHYHKPGSHRYVMAGSLLAADVVISVPKLKTHCKVGVTLAMKNFVGTVGRKQCLAHHRHGGAAQGGDEYPGDSMLKQISAALESRIDGQAGGLVRNLLKFVYRVNERLIKTFGLNPLRDGGWIGNDTAWRMVYDLVRIARFGRMDGSLATSPVRPIISLLDGWVAGENEGPLESTPVPAGTFVFSDEPVLCDMAGALIMGLDPDRIPLLARRDLMRKWNLLPASGDDPMLSGVNINGELGSLSTIPASSQCMHFRPALGWAGKIELGLSKRRLDRT